MKSCEKRSAKSLITLGLASFLLVFSPLVFPADGEIQPPIKAEFTDQITRLKSHSKVRLALDYVETISTRANRELVELTEIAAPPFQESDRARHFSQMLRDAGLKDVRIDEVGNVIGRRPGVPGDRVVAYSAHLDTVFPEGTDVTVKFSDGKMYAPGIGDNTRGLINVLDVLRALQFAKISTRADVLFIGNVGEEGLGDLRGVKHLFRDDAERIDTFIAIDGADAAKIVYGGVGYNRYRVTFKGPGGHSWGAFGLVNPHHALGRAMTHLVSNAKSVTSTGEKTTYSVGRIGGGTSVNSIPFESWMEVDLRSASQSKLEDIDAVFQAAMQLALQEENDARLSGPELTVQVKQVGDRPYAISDPASNLVQRAMAATVSLGIEPSLVLSSTDSNIPISRGIPAVTMSRGGQGGGAHSLAEWWQDEKTHISVQIGILTLLSEAGVNDMDGEDATLR